MTTAVRRLTSTTSASGALALAALLAAACRDATRPPPPAPPVEVRVVATHMEGPAFATSEDGVPLVVCAVLLEATVAGTTSGSANWRHATFRWYAGKDRSTPFDSVEISTAEVQESWGGQTISSGQVQQAGWQFSAGLPFSAEVAYHYEPAGGGAARTATVRFSCGPEPSASTPPPEVRSVALSPASGLVEAGGTVEVTYTASSPLGLWRSAVVLLGPCTVQELYVDSLRTSATRTARLKLPAECALGQPITVAVRVLDAALQESAMQRPTPVTIADRTPPTMRPVFFSQLGDGDDSFAPSGDYFVGDSIQFIPDASDNHRLAAFVWEVPSSGVRDSTVVNVVATPPLSIAYLRVRPEMAGATEFRLFARDASGNSSAPVTSRPGNFRIYPTVSRPTKVGSVPGEVNDALVDTRRGVIYLLQRGARQVAVLSMATMQVTATVALAGPPTSFDLTAGGDSLLVVLSSQRTLGVIDLRPATPQLSIRQLASLDAAVEQAPWAVRVASNGRAFITLVGNAASAYRMLELNLATGAERLRDDAGVGGDIAGAWLERSPDRSALFLTNGFTLQRYDVATDRFGPRRLTGEAGSGGFLSAEAGGRHIALGPNVFDASLQLLRRVRVAPPSIAGPPTRISADGEYLYSLHARLGVVRARVSDGALVDRTPNPIAGALLRLSDDGGTVVTVENSVGAAPSRVSAIDMR